MSQIDLENLDLISLLRMASKRGPETTDAIKKERAAFRAKVASKIDEAKKLMTKAKTDKSASKALAGIVKEMVDAGNLAIDAMLPSYMRALMELDLEQPYVVDTLQYQEWMKRAKKRCEGKDAKLTFAGQETPRCQTNVRNIEQFYRIRTTTDYGSMPTPPPKTYGYQATPETPGDPKGRTQQYGKPIQGYGVTPTGGPGSYGKLPQGYQKSPKGYGDIPGEAKMNARALQEHLAAIPSAHERRERVQSMAEKAGLSVSTSAKVPSINVERGLIALDTLDDVRRAVAATVNATQIVETGTTRMPIAQPFVLVAKRHFMPGDYVAHYDGELVSSESARRIELNGVGETMRTLRAGLWAVRGYSDPSKMPRSAGTGSFAADNLDLCRSMTQGRECRMADTALNTELVTVTHTLNNLASESGYAPSESFLMLVATKHIDEGELIFYRHQSLADYLAGEDDRC